MSKDIMTKNWGTDKIIMPETSAELIPTEMHLKEDGTLDNGPALAIVMTHQMVPEVKIYGQVSIEMLTEALGELGYTLTKT